jgi:hypothetical protein
MIKHFKRVKRALQRSAIRENSVHAAAKAFNRRDRGEKTVEVAEKVPDYVVIL